MQHSLGKITCKARFNIEGLNMTCMDTTLTLRLTSNHNNVCGHHEHDHGWFQVFNATHCVQFALITLIYLKVRLHHSVTFKRDFLVSFNEWTCTWRQCKHTCSRWSLSKLKSLSYKIPTARNLMVEWQLKLDFRKRVPICDPGMRCSFTGNVII